jgi:DNA primase
MNHAAPAALQQAQASLPEVLRLHRQAAEHFAGVLASDERGQGYLELRDISPAAASRFALGLARPTWRDLGAIVADFADVDVLASGLLVTRDGDRAGTRYDRFRDRLIFPIRNLVGNVVAFGGRRLHDAPSDQVGEPPKYINSPETCVFSKGTTLYGLFEAQEAIAERGMVLVVEGYLDVVSTSQAGFEAVVGTLGTACTAEHLAVLFSLTSHIVFCFDGDKAGRDAAARALQVALPWIGRDRNVSFVFLSDEHDPDSLVRAHGAGALEAAIARALSPFELVTDLAQVGCNLAFLEDRARAAHFAGSCWAQLPDGALADSLLRYFAALLKFSMAELHLVWVKAHGRQGR